ncbi:MAG: class I SAM-dependent methyltransferase [Candidatus Cloacimonetes bacterium]|nr:class I SAM-dependent methyltransferase [Candidatus Cloacimonadota bacterium]
MRNYYSKKLSSSNLQKCYEIAPLQVKKYLEAEIVFVLKHINSEDKVLELGCGYGRVLQRLVEKAKKVIGIDTSRESLQFARKMIMYNNSLELFEMNAIDIYFEDGDFDVVICIQNGISAFHVDKEKLIKEAVRVTRSGGKVLFSSYSEKFWEDRLEWFQLQAEHDLIGEIDYEKTGNGVIVCKDGFRATTVSTDEFLYLTKNMNVNTKIIEVDNFSIFCLLKVNF